MSEYYNHGSFPQTGAAGSSAAMRAELELIEAGFNKLPILLGNGGKIVKVNAAADGLEVSIVFSDDGTNGTVSGDLIVAGGNLGPDADSLHTLPNVAADVFALLAAPQTLTNKTIVVANNTVTTAASGNLTSTNLNAALAELQTDIDTRATSTALNDHLNDATDAHDASAISYAGGAGLSATDVESAIDELSTEKLDRTSTTGSAVLPAGTTAQRDGSPMVGYTRYNSSIDDYEGYRSTGWGILGGTPNDFSVTNAKIAFDGGSLGFRNKLIGGSATTNPFQRGKSFTSVTTFPNNDDAYVADRFYLLSDGNDIVDFTQSTDAPTGSLYSFQFDVETANKKFGFAQIIEQKNCQALIGGLASLSFKAKVTGASLTNIKAAVVSWSGTADVVTSDIISAWGADGVTPTLIANATFENTPANLSVTTSWAEYKIENIAIDTASTKNLIVFIWCDNATTTIGDLLNIENVQLEQGSVATAFEARDVGTETELCQRYFVKTFSRDVVPAENTNDRKGSLRAEAWTPDANTVPIGISWMLPVEMRVEPTVTTYNPNAVGNGWRTNDNTGTANATVAEVSTRGALIFINATLGATAGFVIHASALAEL